MSKAASFFAGVKKQIVLKTGSGLLRSRANERRIKLMCSMPFEDGNILGLPDYLSEEYTLVAKQAGMTEAAVSSVEIDGVQIKMYSTHQMAGIITARLW